MKMRRLLFALTVWGFVLSIGPGSALAGGSSNSSGVGIHCYMLFEPFDSLPPDSPTDFLPPEGWFVQVIINEYYQIVILK